MKHTKVLVTGGAGLIGRNVVPILLERGCEVVVLDHFSYPSEAVSSIQADFFDTAVVVPLLKKCDLVIHLAAMLGVDNCRLNPEKVVEINYHKTKDFFDLCVECGVSRIVFSSSSEVYGDSLKTPFKEDGELLPYSEYGKNKVLMEKYLSTLQQKSAVTIGIVRFFNVYGPGQQPTFVVPLFINKCIKNEPITVHGSGEQIRCFTYVGDAALGLVKMCEYDASPYEIINIGRSYEYTMMDLARTVKNAIPESKSEIVMIPYGSNGVRSSDMEVMRRIPSVEKARRLLGFEATTSLENGIALTLQNIKHQ